MLRALVVLGRTLIVLGLFLATPASDVLPVDLLPMMEQLVSGRESPAYVKIVPTTASYGLPLIGAGLMAAGIVMLAVSRRLRVAHQEHE